MKVEIIAIVNGVAMMLVGKSIWDIKKKVDNSITKEEARQLYHDLNGSIHATQENIKEDVKVIKEDVKTLIASAARKD